eukprot:TRINITY_DN12253_c0_g1_i1.p1 TRINITY_DN12253_c0_g1~~TRINITY_DN12253_c0_g1_i1.p1  ORF type:complete len:176 (-),score=1.85 TRINITY_DN12253_c0_g1_i1:182-709(-)
MKVCSRLPLISVALFVVAHFCPAVRFERIGEHTHTPAGLWPWNDRGSEQYTGIEMTLSGILGVLFLQPGALGWLANPLHCAALVCCGGFSHTLSHVFTLSALIAATLSLHLTIWFPLMRDEGGVNYLVAARPLVGHWLWLASMVTLALYVCAVQRERKQSTTAGEKGGDASMGML